MTVLALQAEAAGVDVRLVVAAGALGGGVCIFLRGVAVGTGQAGMLPFQGKVAGVVERNHAVLAVVAVQAGRPELVDMGGHLRRICGRMALNAFGQRLGGAHATGMARGAPDGLPGGIVGVQVESEGSVCVVEWLASVLGGSPSLSRVAGCAVLTE